MLKKLIKPKTATKEYKTFYGINDSINPKDGYFSDSLNLSTDLFPYISSRKHRAIWSGKAYDDYGLKNFSVLKPSYFGFGINGACVINDKLCYTDEKYVFMGSRRQNDAVLFTNIEKRSLVPFKENLFISPEGIYIEKNEDGSYTSCASYKKLICENVAVRYCNINGDDIDVSSLNFPTLPHDGDSAIVCEGNEMLHYRFSAENGWIKIERAYIKIAFTGIELSFSKDEGIYVYCTLFQHPFVKVKNQGENFIVTDGVLDNISASYHNLEITAGIPTLDMSIEFNNRIWGCRYGFDKNQRFVNKIYASSKNKPLSWYDEDSIDFSISAGGVFTGICAMGNSIYFFKEHQIIKIKGDAPDEINTEYFFTDGVKRGSEKSLVNINDVLYYHSCKGLMSFDGIFSRVVLKNLICVDDKDGTAAACNGKYYIFLKSKNNENRLLVYDTYLKTVCKESCENPIRFILPLSSNLVFITFEKNNEGDNFTQHSFILQNGEDTDRLIDFLGSINTENTDIFQKENDFTWYIKTPQVNEYLIPERKSIKRLYISAFSQNELSFDAFVKSDTLSLDKKLCSIKSLCNKIFTFPIHIPFACDSYIYITGAKPITLCLLKYEYEIY